jgi:hypothetical protein
MSILDHFPPRDEDGTITVYLHSFGAYPMCDDLFPTDQDHLQLIAFAAQLFRDRISKRYKKNIAEMKISARLLALINPVYAYITFSGL